MVHATTATRGYKKQWISSTPRGSGFSSTLINSCLRAIQMDRVFGARTVTHFNPKNLGLNAGFSGLSSDSPELNFLDCFWTIWD